MAIAHYNIISNGDIRWRIRWACLLFQHFASWRRNLVDALAPPAASRNTARRAYVAVTKLRGVNLLHGSSTSYLYDILNGGVKIGVARKRRGS